MVGRLGRHVASNAVGYVALFFALGGSAYAVGAKEERPGPTARAASDTTVLGRYKDGPVQTTNTASTALLSLPLAAGRYIIIAKAVVPREGKEIECRVTAGSDFDRAKLFQHGGSGTDVMTLTVLHRSDANFVARLTCADGDTTEGWNLRDLKLSAIRVNSFSNRAG